MIALMIMTIATIVSVITTAVAIHIRKVNLIALKRQCVDCIKKENCSDYLGNDGKDDIFKLGIYKSKPVANCPKKITK